MRRLALISEAAPEEVVSNLGNYGFDVIKLRPHPSLPPPVASHADMLTAALDNRVFFDKIYIEANPDTVRAVTDAGHDVEAVPETVGPEYPDDIALNVLIAGSFALGHAASSETLRRRIGESGRTFVPVKQGYAACSTLYAGGLLISADAGIVKAASRFCDTLRITPGHIELEPYGEGFIGGASVFDGESAYFTGDVFSHPDGREIVRLLAARGVESRPLSQGSLCDVGGIRFL